jgi:hypothetical protein
MISNFSGRMLLLIILTPFSFFVSNTVVAQSSSFVKMFNFNPEFSDKGITVIADDQHAFISTGSVVQLPAWTLETGLLKLDRYGEPVWYELLNQDSVRFTSGFQESMVFKEDSILIATRFRGSNRYQTQAHLAIAKSDGRFRAVKSPEDSIYDISGALSYSWDSSFLYRTMYVYDEDANGFPMRLQKLDLAGNKFWERRFFDGFRRLIVRDHTVDTDDSTLFAHVGCIASCVNKESAYITKIDSAGQFLWRRDYGGSSRDEIVLPLITPLANERFAFSWTRDTVAPDLQISPPAIFILNEFGDKLDSIIFDGAIKTLMKIKTARNGDIIGAGYAWTTIGYTGWMIRVTPDAELVWERFIQDHRLDPNADTDLTGLAETADGGIIAVGTLFGNLRALDGGSNGRTWVVKLDADGCLEPGCSSDTIHLQKPVSSTTNLPEPSVRLRISPNPVVDQFMVGLEGVVGLRYPLRYTVISNDGRMTRNGTLAGPDATVDVRDFPAGLHYFHLYDGEQVLGVNRFVKW